MKKKTPSTNTGSTLNKFLAHAGICSRRTAVTYIKEGKVTVNNALVVDPGYRVMPRDIVHLNTQRIKQQSCVYLLLNKPTNYVTTVRDERGRKTVLDLIPSNIKERLYPVGRLDRDTTGLLLMTNDGELANRLAHPRHGIQKTYFVKLETSLNSCDLHSIRTGVELEDGIVKVDEISYADRKWRNELIITLHSGKNRVIRRLFKSLGYTIKVLDRIMYAGISKEGIKKGECRYVTQDELQGLRELVGIKD